MKCIVEDLQVHAKNETLSLLWLSWQLVKRVLQLNVVVPVGSQSVVAIKFLKFSSSYVFREIIMKKCSSGHPEGQYMYMKKKVH